MVVIDPDEILKVAKEYL